MTNPDLFDFFARGMALLAVVFVVVIFWEKHAWKFRFWNRKRKIERARRRMHAEIEKRVRALKDD